jgi:predicted Zn-dependent peptidase
MEGLYEVNPIRVNICGTERSISRITPEILRECYDAFYRPSNMALIVCGNVCEEDVMRIVDRVLPNVPSGAPIERWLPEEGSAAYRLRIEACMQTAKPIFSIGIKDVNIPRDPAQRMRRDAAQSLLEEILFSRSGQFYNGLFEDGFITPSYSYGYSIAEGFAFHAISGECDTPETVEARLWEYLNRVKREGIDREEFERCRRALYADEIRNYDSTEDIATALLTFVFDGVELFDYPNVIADLTCEELTPLLDEMIDRSAFCMSVVYPLDYENQQEKGD